jgi:hypothetical protein
MLFNIEADTGARVTGYIVPDNFSSTPNIVLQSQGRDAVMPSTRQKRRLTSSRASVLTGARTAVSR